MSEEKNYSILDELEMLDKEEHKSSINFQNIYKILVLNWQWFLLSLLICLGGAMLYLHYKTPTYGVSAKMLVKDEQKNRSSGNMSQMLSNMQDFGIMTNSAGVENEVEILKSHLLAREAIVKLKLYASYKLEGLVKNTEIYKHQPVNVDLSQEALNQMDADLLESINTLKVTVTKEADGYVIEGTVLRKGKESDSFHKTVKTLPVSLKTSMGTVTVSSNLANADPATLKKFESGRSLYVTLEPPMAVAKKYVNSMNVKPTSKKTSIAKITVNNSNRHRAIDFIKALVQSYNEQANEDKNEIALKTEEFINERLEKIDAELGSTEGELEDYKKRNRVTQFQLDAAKTLNEESVYAAKLMEANTQLQLISYLREFVDNPTNKYEIIPSNVGLTDPASTTLITKFNEVVLDRNRLLKSASEQSPQVLTLTQTLDEIRPTIRTALMQAQRSAEISRQGIEEKYGIYQSRIANSPERERVLTQIGRQQEVKSGLYLLLLQKREENSISLAATADKGKLIDEPQVEGKVSPKKALILAFALVLALGIPSLVLYVIHLMRFRIEGHEDVESLTSLPIVADVPMASDSVKTSAGIVVQANKNNQIDEIFRSMRTNIQFMMKEHEQVILFTSSTSGEGKTFLAANLAMSFALLGKKVVLCGLDIRKPALGRLFGLKDRSGGISLLLAKEEVTESDLSTALRPSGVDNNLDLMLAGPIPPNPAELLARENMHQIIELLKQKYDYIILDTAPVGLVTDTLQIARYADVSCYVCRADYTPKANIGLINTLVEEEKLKNVCLILNGIDMSKKKYGYDYGYGRYGKYGRYGNYGHYGNYGNYADSHYSNKNDDSIKK
jgi:capsular exopolysaccharide synthesis family protein